MGFYGVLPKENITESVSFSVCYDEYLNRKRMLESCTDDNRLILESEVQLLREIYFKDIINKIKDFFIFIGNKIRDFFKFITEKINELRIKIMVKRAVKNP